MLILAYRKTQWRLRRSFENSLDQSTPIISILCARIKRDLPVSVCPLSGLLPTSRQKKEVDQHANSLNAKAVESLRDRFQAQHKEESI